MNKFINLTFLVLYCSFIFWLSSKPTLPAPMLFTHQDKIFHMGAYFIMGILAWRFFNDLFAKPIIVFLVSLCFSSIYGISDEWHQSHVPGREADILDWLADTLGAITALVAIQLTRRKFKLATQTG
ncbi:MAG TPA: VanZ family protein [Bacteroidetes bacterium]|nr:VanZ family protein [Bacteroidota bacterium]